MEVVPALILELILINIIMRQTRKKVTIIRNTVIRAVKKVKTKGKFDYERFCQDLQNVTEN